MCSQDWFTWTWTWQLFHTWSHHSKHRTAMGATQPESSLCQKRTWVSLKSTVISWLAQLTTQETGKTFFGRQCCEQRTVTFQLPCVFQWQTCNNLPNTFNITCTFNYRRITMQRQKKSSVASGNVHSHLARDKVPKTNAILDSFLVWMSINEQISSSWRMGAEQKFSPFPTTIIFYWFS